MITFVFDEIEHGIPVSNLSQLDSVHASQFRFLDYLQHEGVEYDIVATDNIDNIEHVVVYPIQLEKFDQSIDLMNILDARVIEAASEHRLIIAIFLKGCTDITGDVIESIFDWYEEWKLPIGSVKVITDNYKLSSTDPFVYFCEDEISTKIAVMQEKLPTVVNLVPRSKKFSCDINSDSQVATLFGACLWQQALHKQGYFCNTEVNSPALLWEEYFSNNDLLMAQYELQLPLCEDIDYGTAAKESYWRFIIEDEALEDTTSVSSQVFRAIAYMQPFIIAGTHNEVGLLNHLGYSTFDGYVDELYDSVINDEHRMFDVLSEIFTV